MANGENMGTIGTVAGAAIGSAFGMPQIGAMAGQAIGSTIGGSMQRKAAREAMPSAVDPMQSTMLEQVRRRRRAMETGAAFSNAKDGIQSQLATTQRNILKRSGGQTGSAIAGIGLAQGQAARQLGALQAEQIRLGNELAAQEQALADKMVGRRLLLQMERAKSLEAQGKEDYSMGMQNLMSFIGQMNPEQMKQNVASLGSNVKSLFGGGNQLASAGSNIDPNTIATPNRVFPKGGQYAWQGQVSGTGTTMPYGYGNTPNQPRTFVGINTGVTARTNNPLSDFINENGYTPTKDDLDAYIIKYGY